MSKVFDCPKCGEEGCVERVCVDTAFKETARCTECRANFKVDQDWSWDGDAWKDYSTLGAEIK